MNPADSPPPWTASSPIPAKTSSLAVASLILGILGFLVVPALAGLVCGIVALIRINGSAGALKGKGIAIAGTVISGVMLVFLPILAILAGLLLPALAKAKVKAQSIMGLNNVKQINLALHLYAADSKDTLPASTNWCDAVRPLLAGNAAVFLRPADQHQPIGSFSSYAYNSRLSGLKVSDVNPQTVTVFEADAGNWNLSGGSELLRRTTRSSDPVVVGFADGHAEMIPPGPRLNMLRWDP